MSNPLFSIVVPAYNQAEFLPDAIQGVLTQTFADFEIIIVNDASPDNTTEIVQQFTDPRIKYLVHEKNKGLPGARNTGMRTASGELIALLDADDYFHPDKLEMHRTFLEKNPTIDITYNSRFEFHHSSPEVRTIYQPPKTVDIDDLLLGFPFSPSDMVMRRGCMRDVGVFDDQLICGGEDFDYPIRLALAGKKFSRVDKALNYRRFHAGRKRKKLLCRMHDYTHVLDQAFIHLNFPPHLTGQHNHAYANRFLEVACYALSQEEFPLGKDVLEEVYLLAPGYFEGHPSIVLQELLQFTTRDFHHDHEALLTAIVNYVAPLFPRLQEQLPRTIAKGYFQKAILSLIWDYSGNKEAFMNSATEMKSHLKASDLDHVIFLLLEYNNELGDEPTSSAMQRIKPFIQDVFGGCGVQHLAGYYEFNKMLTSYQEGKYRQVPTHAFRALRAQPAIMKNRGVWSIMVRSIGKSIKAYT